MSSQGPHKAFHAVKQYKQTESDGIDYRNCSDRSIPSVTFAVDGLSSWVFCSRIGVPHKAFHHVHLRTTHADEDNSSSTVFIVVVGVCRNNCCICGLLQDSFLLRNTSIIIQVCLRGNLVLKPNIKYSGVVNRS